MTTTFRHLVSKQKRRFQEDGFDLDLSYVTDNIIAMGFPSEDNERFYRNPYSEVIRFLDKRHKDKFKIYNLCSERGYDPEKFYNRVGVFPFDDHNAPRFELIEELCVDVRDFLAQDPDNVAVIHCKAGKGRTGLMICCWLLYNKDWPTAEAAQQFYAAMRTKNQKGVTIPSQIRYIKYFEERMKMEKWEPDYQAVGLKSITLNGIPKIPNSSELKMTLFMDKKPHSPWKPTEQEKESYRKVKKGKGGANPSFVIDCGDFPVIRDVKVQFDEKKFSSQEVLCTFWFNTHFIKNNRLHLEQPEIDRANKDKQNRIFPEGFSVDIEFDTVVNIKGQTDDDDGYDEDKGLNDDEESQPGSKIARSATLVVENEDGEPIPIPSRVSEPLNLRGGPWSGEARHPCEVAIDLLDKAIELYKHCLPKKATHTIDRYVPKRAGDHEKDLFQALETATAELNQVSLNGLEENDLAVFWLNTLNLMYLHSFIVYGPPNNPATREKILENSNYSIGKLVYPLVVVEQILLLGNLPKPSPSELSGLKLPKIKLKEKDGRKTFQLKNPSPLLYFGISGGAKCLPIITVFRSPETLQDDLKKLVRIAFSKVVVKSKIVQNVPVYLSWYRKNFGKKDTDMVDYLAKAADLDLKEYKEVAFEDANWEFGSFFLHYQRGVSLEEGWSLFQEMEDQKASDEKDAKKADLLAQLEEIDELEEIDNENGEAPNDGQLASSSPNFPREGGSSSSTPDRGPSSFSSSSNMKSGGSKKKLKKSSSRKFKGVGGSKTAVSPDSPKGKKNDSGDDEKKEKKDKKKEKEGDGEKKEKKDKKKKKEGKEKSGKEDEERVIPPPPTDFVPPPEESPSPN